MFIYCLIKRLNIFIFYIFNSCNIFYKNNIYNDDMFLKLTVFNLIIIYIVIIGY